MKVRSVPSATTRCKKDHVKPSIRDKSNHFILHVETNDLATDREPELLAKSIVDVAQSMKSDDHDVTISNIIHRDDNLNEKAQQVNRELKKLFIGKNIRLLDHKGFNS